jgi:hypothetical protein
MIHIQTVQAVAASPEKAELEQGSLWVVEPPSPSRPAGRKKKKKKGKD